MPSPNPTIASAADAVLSALRAYEADHLSGRHEHRIRPAAHPHALQSAAPALAALLRDAELAAASEESERQAALSRKRQKEFRQKWIGATASAFAFTIASGAVLAVNAGLDAGSALRQTLSVSLSIVALLSAGVGVWLVTDLRRKRPFTA